MRRSDRAPRQRRRRSALLALLAVGGLVLGLGSSVPVRAQEDVPTGDELFGSFALEARALGVQGTYELVGLLPGGARVLDLSLPETLARFGSGPTGYGLASVAYPGGLIVNLPSLAAQTGFDASAIPDYPIKAETFFPSGPTDITTEPAPGLLQRAVSTELGVEAVGTFPAIDAPPAIKVGSIRSASRSSIEEGKAVSRARVELGEVAILGGVITIESLITDLVAVHDGKAGESAGGTRATGVRFLGLAADLTEDGLVLTEAPPVSGVGGPLGGVLNPVLEPLQDLTAPVRAALADVLDQAVPSLNGVLAAAGVEVSLLSPQETAAQGGGAGRASSGLSITLTYEGREQAALVDLINSIPAELKPSIGPIPNPVVFLAENHITGLTLGHASVSALASSPFDIAGLDGDLPLDSGASFPGSFEAGAAFTPPAFETPTPAIPTPTAAVPTEGISIATDAIPAAVLVLLALLSPFLGIGSTRLADNVLAATATSCPSGLDQPPSRSRQP